MAKSGAQLFMDVYLIAEEVVLADDLHPVSLDPFPLNPPLAMLAHWGVDRQWIDFDDGERRRQGRYGYGLSQLALPSASHLAQAFVGQGFTHTTTHTSTCGIFGAIPRTS